MTDAVTMSNELTPNVRQLVICCDGTNNTLTGRQRDTNVLRVFEHLSTHGGAQQVLYYDPGVGSPDALPSTGFGDWMSRKWERVFGLASGRGIYENIGEAYAFLMRTWRPGDEIWLFGFSRGAFTARCVAGMVNLFGILRPEHESLLPTLMRVYFSPSSEHAQNDAFKRRTMTAQSLLGIEVEDNEVYARTSVARQIRQSFTTPEAGVAAVHFVGVWDTVESVGIPGLSLQITSAATIKGKRMLHVRHALSLDEHRKNFLPRLYSEDNFGGPRDAQSLLQLWFRGNHGDAGGGYSPAESELSNAALCWMVDEGIACGLRCPEIEPAAGEVMIHDEIHKVPWWSLAGLSVRDTRRGDVDPDSGRPVPVRPVAHLSVAMLSPMAKSFSQLHPQSKSPLFVAAFVIFAGLGAYGSVLLDRAPDISSLGNLFAELRLALQATGDLALGQLNMLWAVPLNNWREVWMATPHAGPLGVLFGLDFLLIAAYSFLLARLISPAFTRLAGLRNVGDAMPWWRWLGASLTVMLVGDIVENLSTLAALCIEGNRWQWLPLFAAGIGAVGKWLGMAGCAVLTVMGFAARPSTVANKA